MSSIIPIDDEPVDPARDGSGQQGIDLPSLLLAIMHNKTTEYEGDNCHISPRQIRR
jgi:hypothetical protein